MTIDRTIEREKLEAVSYCDLATTYHTYGNIYSRAEEAYRAKAEYHAQIAEWLKDYKRLLEQEPVLDKIRAEIEQITDTMGVSYNQYVSKIDVLQIIDKYKSESEDKK